MTLTKRESLTNQIALGVCSCSWPAARPAGLDQGGRRWLRRRTQECWSCLLCSIPSVRNHASNILKKLMASTPPLTTVTGTRTGFG